MAHYSKEVKDEVRKKYVYEKQPLAKVAKSVNVPYGTVARWKKQAKEQGDDWDKVKFAHTKSGGSLEELARQVITEFILQHEYAFNELKDNATGDKIKQLATLSDSLAKTVSVNKRLMPETSELATAFKVMNMLSDFVATQAPQHLELFANDVIIPFGELLEKELK